MESVALLASPRQWAALHQRAGSNSQCDSVPVMRVLPRVSGSSGSCGAAPSHTHSHGTDVTQLGRVTSRQPARHEPESEPGRTSSASSDPPQRR